MSILNVNQLQPVGGGNTITVGSSNIDYSGSITGNISVDGNLTVTGVVSNDDVTNIDSVGIITARSGLQVTGGNVGIGTNNAAQKLHVSGGTGTNIQVQQSNGNLYLGSSGSTRFGLASGANIIQSTATDFAIGSQSGHDFIFGTNNTERVRISSAGDATFKHKVNIGDSHSGGEILLLGKSSGTSYTGYRNGGTYHGFIGHADQLVSGGAATDFAIRAQNNLVFATGGNTERMRIMSDGTLKIGTGTGNPILMLSASTSGTSVIQMGDSADNNIGQIHYANSDDSMRFFTNNAERLRISNIGHVITKGNNQGNPVGIEIRNNNTNAYSHAQLELTSQNATTSKIWCDVPNSGMRLNYNGGSSVKIDQSGNLHMPNGAGIDFSATGDASGMTSELLDDYEEGTWTPVDNSAGLTLSPADGRYVKVGSLVHCWGRIAYPSTSNTSLNSIGGFPFANLWTNPVNYSGNITITNYGSANILPMVENNQIQFRDHSNATFNNSQLSSKFIYFEFDLRT